MPKSGRAKKWERVLIFVTFVLIALGILVTFLSRLSTDLSIKTALIGVGVGIIAVGIGFLGVWIAQKSDNKMAAIANLEFDEKGAMIEEYEAYFSKNFDKTKFERFRWDLEAMAHVAEWADEDKRARISRSVDIITTAVDGKVTKDSLERIRSLSSKIRG